MDYKTLTIHLPAYIENEIISGRFEAAKRSIENLLKVMDMPDESDQAITDRLLIERQRIDLIAEQYTVSYEQLKNALFDTIDHFNDLEFETLMSSGLLQWRYVEGEKKFHIRSIKTAARKYFTRLKNCRYFDGHAYLATLKALQQHMGHMIEHDGLRLDADIASCVSLQHQGCITDSEMVHAYLPIPKLNEMNLTSWYPSKPTVADMTSLQRTVYFKGSSATLSYGISYTFGIEVKRKKMKSMHQMRYNMMNAVHDEHIYYFQKNELCDLSMTGHSAQYLEEEKPHIIFGYGLKRLVEKLIKGAEDSFEKAWRCYDYVTRNIQYTFMPDYRVIDNLSEFAYVNKCGDCGTQSLMLITMLRIAGIPATFYSGVVIDPVTYKVGMHDWLAYYIPEYGWIEADVSYGADAYQTGNEMMRRFYFTGVDLYRIQMNSGFYKKWMNEKINRQDPFDNQMGELGVENSDVALPFNTDMNVKSLNIMKCDK